ncbi:MAG: hypothetical protein ABFQ53_04030 [Patescibacteria group bacterium]
MTQRKSSLKTSHNSLYFYWVVSVCFSVIFLLCVYRIVDVPDGFFMTSLDIGIWSIFLGNIWLFALSVTSKFAKSEMGGVFLRTSVTIFFLTGFLMPTFIGCVPIWTNVPTQEQLKEQKQQKAINEFEVLTSNVEKFKFALVQLNGFLVSPDENSSFWIGLLHNSFLKLCEEDFEGTMDKYGLVVFKGFLGLEDEMYIFQMYEDYLKNLINSNQHNKLYIHCERDVWNFMTPHSYKNYEELWSICNK